MLQIAEHAMHLKHSRILPLYNRRYVPRQRMAKRLPVVFHRCIFAGLALVNNCLILIARQCFLQIDPSAMQTSGDMSRGRGSTSQLAHKSL